MASGVLSLCSAYSTYCSLNRQLESSNARSKEHKIPLRRLARSRGLQRLARHA